MSFPYLRHLFGICCMSSLLACSSEPSVDVGDTQVGTFTFHISREGVAPDPGVTTRFVVKPTAGGKPTAITGWVGSATGEGSVKSAAVFDSGDGDFDDDVMVPSPMPPDAKFYFEVTAAGAVMVGSVALK
jgi:hypothetical protein